MNQRAQYTTRNLGKKTWLTEDRVQLLDDIGFIWNPQMPCRGMNEGKSASSATKEEKKADEKKEGKPGDDSESKEKSEKKKT